MSKQKAKPKFSFKLQPKATGLSAVGNTRQSADIKFEKAVCGIITAPNWMSKTNEYTARITVKHNDPTITHCDWRWVTLNIQSPDIQVVKDWLNEKAPSILEKYTLHFLDRD